MNKIQDLRKLEKLEENAEEIRKSIDVDFSELENFSQDKVSKLSNFISKISNIKIIEAVDLDKIKDVYNYQLYNKKKKELESIVIDDKVKLELESLEALYSKEQKRIKENQELIKEYQKLENDRLKQLSKYEQERKNIKERNENFKKDLEKFKKDEEERYRQYQLEKQLEEEKKLKVVSEIKMLQDKLEKDIAEQSALQIDKTCQEKYRNLENSLSEKKILLQEALYSQELIQKGKQLEEKRKTVVALQKDVESLTRLKLKAIDVECKQLEDTVNNINTVLETTLPIFFSEPISLTLLLYKKVKNNIKPCLNLEICYKGCKYDDVDSLSGGEGDRISLALLLALNFVSNSPIILLDECVSSLDGELKESCITAIKSIPNKTVICIDHDDTMEGFYDQIIKLEK